MEPFVLVEPRRANRHGRPAKRLLLAIAVVLALLTSLAFLAGPLVLRPLAERRLGLWLGRKVTIERIRVNPVRMSITAEGLQVREADGTSAFLTVRRLYLDLQMASVLRRALIVREIRVESPRVLLQRRRLTAGGDAVYNISDLLARFAPAPAATATVRGPLPRFSLNNIRVLDGTLVFDDAPLGRRHTVTELALGFPFLSTLAADVDTFVEPGASGRVDGAPWAIAGKTKPFKDTLQSVVELRLTAVDVVPYVPYVPHLPLPPHVTVASAELTVSVELAFARPRSGPPLLSLRGTVALGNVTLRAPGPASPERFGLGYLAVTAIDIDPLRRRYFLDDVLVSGLDASLLRTASGTLSIPGLWSARAPAPEVPGASPAPAAAAAEDGTRFSIRKVRLESSTLRFRDEGVRPAFESTVDDLAVSIDHLSNAGAAEATVAVALRASPGGTLALNGRFSLGPLRSLGTISLDDVQPRRLAAYWRDDIPFEIVPFEGVQARLRLSAGYELTEERGHLSLRLREGSGEARALALRRPLERTAFLTVPELAVRGVEVDFDGRTASVSGVSARDGRLELNRRGRGAVDAAPLVRPTIGRPWALAVARFDADGWGIRFEDRAVVPAAVLTFRSLSLHATSLSTAPGSKGGVELRAGLGRRGRLAVRGTLGLAPPAAELRAEVRAADLVPLRGYLRSQAKLLLTSGLLSFKGDVRVDPPADGDGGGAGRPSPPSGIRLAGDADLADVRLVGMAGPDAGRSDERADEEDANDQDLLRWRALHLGALTLSTAPARVAIGDARLTDFSGGIAITSRGRLNWGEVFVEPGPVAPRAGHGAGAPRSVDFSLGAVDLARGEVRFVDRSLHPKCAAQLTDLAGRVTGLSTAAGTRGTVDLRGRLGLAGLVAVTGTASPLQSVPAFDLKGEAKNVDLRPASPYAARYLGYQLDRGTLSLAVTYHIADGHLDAHNRLVMENLAFGERVSSPDAVHLPVKLAVAVLQDRHGVIDIDLPLSGALADPHFRPPSLLWRALRGKVIAATEAPFPLIARAFGGAEPAGDLSSLSFPAGSASLDVAARAKIEQLADALRARPLLALELRGESEPRQDGEALRRARGPQAEIHENDLRELARRRAEAVETALTRLAPAVTGRLFLIAPVVNGEAARVGLKAKAAD